MHHAVKLRQLVCCCYKWVIGENKNFSQEGSSLPALSYTFSHSSNNFGNFLSKDSCECIGIQFWLLLTKVNDKSLTSTETEGSNFLDSEIRKDVL